MTTEVLRHRDRLTIRWANEDGDEWAVTKRFRQSMALSASIRGPAIPLFDHAQAARQYERELHYAAALAETMDCIFAFPEDFDLVSIADAPAPDGCSALISPPDVRDGRIYIAIPGNS